MRSKVLWILCSLVLGTLALPADKDQASNDDGGSQASKKDDGVAIKKRSPLMMPGMGGLGSMDDLGGLGGGGLGGLGGGGFGGGGLSALGGGLGGLGGGMPNLLSMANPSSSSASSGADSSPLSGLMGMGGLSGIGNLGSAGKFASSLSRTRDTTSPSPNDAPASTPSTPGCPPLYLIFARGTAELQGTFGIVGRPLCTGLQQAVPGTLCYDTVYTSDAEYMVSPGIGANTASQFIASIAAKCPTTKYALAGYSKGAMVVHRIHAKNVVAAVTFGDPLKMQAVQSTNDVKTFCNLGDPVCENGMMIMAHLTYSMQDIPLAVQFIVQAFKSSGPATRRKRNSRRKQASHGAGP
ncbi:hypothetical protein PaG_05532 [Moesziomyces aphidis]|uniref:cutinase n=1 Tax=Moesziomyces aphidis TaxID=84754 RepID=W3VFK8_MOEAP|nr:hypothetical protein PaG_05532 [Moesziomyces aphidis]